ncbi:MAG: glycosyltransferase [Methylotenera sp.]|nr:glycosyltransferase [Oligoflexia bacterium]
MKQTKVLHIFGKMDRGGAEMRTLELMEALNRAPDSQIQFDFCALSGKPGELDSRILELGGTVFHLPLDAGFPRKFRELLRRQGYLAVHSHVHLFSGYILKLATDVGVPVKICHLHTTGDSIRPHFRKRIQNQIMRWLLFRHATDVIGVSDAALKVFINEAPRFSGDGRCKMIYDAIDIQSFQKPFSVPGIRESIGIPQDATLVIHVGRIEKVKNHTRLVSIFSRLEQTLPHARLLLVGNFSAAAKRSLDEHIGRLGIGSKVVFLGSRTDIPALLFASDLMVFPSLWEGLPGAVLEASATGLPVLSSDLPGSLEIGRFFPTLKCLGLSQSDEIWSESAGELLRIVRDRTLSLKALQGSPFEISNCIPQLERIWKNMPRI